MAWTCPACARTFAREDQFHSHDTEDVDAHFAGRPGHLRESFDILVGLLPSDVRIEPLRTVIVLAARGTFAYVTVEARQLSVGVLLEHGIDSSRVLKVDRVSARKVGSVVAVRSPLDVDEELSGWLREAYELGATAAERER
jgi:hypothetical protein